MATDVFRRAGRGGAGNYWSKKDIEEAERTLPKVCLALPTSRVECANACCRRLPSNPAANAAGGPQELDAQKKVPGASADAAGQSGPVYNRAGRGGAGNFHDTDTVAEVLEKEEEAQRARAALAASSAKPKAGLSGRGGLGNWTDNSQEAEEDERKKKQAMEARILQDVELGLAMPARTYHVHDRDAL